MFVSFADFSMPYKTLTGSSKTCCPSALLPRDPTLCDGPWCCVLPHSFLGEFLSFGEMLRLF